MRRIRVEERVELFRGGELDFIEVHSDTIAIAKKKLSTYRELQGLPPSAKFVYKMLELEGSMGVRELAQKLSYRREPLGTLSISS